MVPPPLVFLSFTLSRQQQPVCLPLPLFLSLHRLTPIYPANYHELPPSLSPLAPLSPFCYPLALSPPPPFSPPSQMRNVSVSILGV